MKLFFNFLLFLFVFVKSQSTVDDNNKQNNNNKIERFIYDRCYTFSTNAVNYDTLKNHVTDFSSFAEYTFNLLPEGKEQFCKTEKDRLLTSAKQIIQDLNKCLPSNEKYLPDFLLKSFENFLEFLCKKHGRNIDNFFSQQGKDCRNKIKQNNGDEQLEICFNKIFSPLEHYIKKKELCDDLSVARKCFSMLLEKNCPNFVSFHTLNSEFFNTISEPCSGCYTIIINNILLLFIVVFYAIFTH